MSNLDVLRYQSFVKSSKKISKLSLARLPPTSDAFKLHALRTYHTIQKWLGNEKNPTDWGWIRTEQGLTPKMFSKDPAPQSLLSYISCGCKKDCKGACSCKKAGLTCSSLCRNCLGKSCTNVIIPILDDEFDSDVDEDEFILTADTDEKGLKTDD